MPIRDDRILGSPTSVAFKDACRVATTANITLSGLQTIDGVSLVADDRVLVCAQTDQTDNGIWVVSSTGWTRARDADGNRDLVRGTFVNVYAGTTAYGWYEVTTSNPIVIGTSSLTFTRWLLTAA